MMRAIQNLEEMKAFAGEIASEISREDRILLLLDGPMGAGKTQFTRFLVEALGGEGTTSPTFAIHNQYVVKRGTVDHFDLFRLASEDELESSGFWDLFHSRKSTIVVEWASRINELGLERQLSSSWRRLRLTFVVPQPGSNLRHVGRAR